MSERSVKGAQRMASGARSGFSWAGPAAVSAAVLVALTLLPAGGLAASSPPSPPSTTLLLTANHYHWWCSSEKTPAPAFSVATSNGSWSGVTQARACPGGHGAGASDDSYAIDQAEVQLTVPISPAPGPGGALAGWQLRLDASTHTAYGLPVRGCPWIWNNNTVGNASGLFNYSFGYQWCDVEAVVNVAGSAVLKDLTTGKTVAASNSWPGIHYASGIQIINYWWTGNYTNRSYWAWNYSVGYSQNYTFFNSTSSSVSASPAWFMNTTFTGGHRYVVIVSLNESIAAESFMFFGGSASARFNASTGPRHEDLASVRVY